MIYNASDLTYIISFAIISLPINMDLKELIMRDILIDDFTQDLFQNAFKLYFNFLKARL